MSIECGECESNVYQGHAESCSRHPLNRIKSLQQTLTRRNEQFRRYVRRMRRELAVSNDIKRKMMKENEELKKELHKICFFIEPHYKGAGLKAESKWALAELQGWAKDLDQRGEEIDQLREGLRKYGVHRAICASRSWGDCNCGLAKLIGGEL